jgi:hypothetical protein
MTVLSGSVYDYVAMILPPLPGNYFEIGVFNGAGFARIAQENPNKTCYAVDPFIEDGNTVAHSGVDTGSRLSQQKQNFLEYTKELTNVVLYEMTSASYAAQLTNQQCQDLNISIVVIDGDHHYPNVVIDFDIAARLLGDRAGQIVVDDVNVADVDKAYNEFVAKFKHRIEREVDAGGPTKVILFKETNE